MSDPKADWSDYDRERHHRFEAIRCKVAQVRGERVLLGDAGEIADLIFLWSVVEELQAEIRRLQPPQLTVHREVSGVF